MKKRRLGKVFLVGSGPGDTDLLTLKGKEALESAEAVVFDSLVNPEILQFAPRAKKIFVGKKGGLHSIPQEKIHRILLRLVRQGKKVVRLKGGDPFIFGRGGEEANFLAEHRIPFEVIPGVSAGMGASAYAGIPLTDRRFASQVIFVTAHEDPGKGDPAVDWEKLAGFQGTLVAFMGARNLGKVVRALVRGGKSTETPVAVIERGTFPDQRVISGTLKNIAEKAQEARVQSPALTVIGEVVRLRRKLAWFEKKSLRGKTIVVTRARDQASELAKKLSDQGARVIEFPTIEILPPSHPEQIDREIRRLGRYHWVVFTSVNGVHFFFERMQRLGLDARIFSSNRIAAIGEATAEALRQRGLLPDLIPKKFTSSDLFQALKKRGEVCGKRFLLARADIAPPALREALEKEGARVVEIQAYRTRPVGGERGTARLRVLFKQNKIHCVTFTSSSTAENFFKIVPPRLLKKGSTQLISIGPVTTQTLKRHGLKPAQEAAVQTLEGLVEALSNGGRNPS